MCAVFVKKKKNRLKLVVVQTVKHAQDARTVKFYAVVVVVKLLEQISIAKIVSLQGIISAQLRLKNSVHATLSA